MSGHRNPHADQHGRSQPGMAVGHTPGLGSTAWRRRQGMAGSGLNGTVSMQDMVLSISHQATTIVRWLGCLIRQLGFGTTKCRPEWAGPTIPWLYPGGA